MRLVMGRTRNWWNHPRTVALIWAPSFILFFLLLRMAFRSSSFDANSSAPDSPGAKLSDHKRREILYDKMEKDLDEHGAVFLKQGETSQSLRLSELFTLVDGFVTPLSKAATPPVRANVLYLSPEYSKPIAGSVSVSTISMAFHHNVTLWLLAEKLYNKHFPHTLTKNSSLYHFSMFHASHHISPVPASDTEIDAEAEAVKAVTKEICPLKIILDRVVLTSSGVLLGCWQVDSGTDPTSIRAKLRRALPHAPEKQLYDAAILHTSFARLLGPPKTSSADHLKASGQLQFFHELVTRLNNRIRGSQATVSELWYVEEYDVLALALNGRMKVRRFELHCSGA